MIDNCGIPGTRTPEPHQMSTNPTDRPNILVIMSDQHSPHVIGCAGDDVVRTPILDQLAADGIRFDATYCPSPVCCASRSSFMTGRYPTNTGVWCNSAMLNSSMPTWAHVLGLAGYETSLIGRMHFDGPDQYHGFENRPIGEFGARHPGAPGGGERYPTGQGRNAIEACGHGTTTYQWLDRRVADAACDYLQDRATSNRPFAAVVGFVLPHCPFIAPKELFDYYHDRVTLPPQQDDHPPMIQDYLRPRKQADPPMDPKYVRGARAAYYGMCELMDELIGQVLSALESSGLAENTLVIYTSDHGEMVGEHSCWTKNVYYEASARVPMLVRWPGVVKPGAVSDRVCNLVDIGPTLADIVGAEDVPDWDGRSLLPLLHGEETSWDNATKSEIVDTSINPPSPSRMLRRDQWKIWAHLDTDDQLHVTLFDLNRDPDEMHDLASDPQHQSTRDSLFTELMNGWDPQAARAITQQKRKDFRLVSQWGRVMQPRLPEQVPPPPADLEDDVVLV